MCVCFVFLCFLFFSLSLTPISPNCHTPILPIASENDWYEVRVCIFFVFFSLSLSLAPISPNCHTPILPICGIGVFFWFLFSHSPSFHPIVTHPFFPYLTPASVSSVLLSALGTPRRLLVERAPRSLAEHLAELRGRSRAPSEREARCGPRPNAQAHHCSARMRVDPSRSASARDAPGDATRRWHPL